MRAPLLALGAALAAVAPLAAQDEEAGRRVYQRWCVECHGPEGGGDGPAAAWMLPRPRDFVRARYQIRTTAVGELPTDADLRRVIREGMPGTAMPGWPDLSDAEVDDLIAFLKSLSPFFEGESPESMALGEDPGGGGEVSEEGARIYEMLECWKCHGREGRGDGQSAPTLEDWRDLPIRAADLTEPWFFNGGPGAEAIHTRFLTGLDGTPMPAYSDALASGVVSEEELWTLARYVAGFGPERRPEVRELIRARRSEEGLPESADVAAWDAVEAAWVPLVGQVIRPPRQFAPAVDGVWIRALHDGESVALLLEWNDPSPSPDPAWEEWRVRLVEKLPAEGDPSDPGPGPDGFTVQLPAELGGSTERPYFLLGDSRRAVELWWWESDGAGPRAATAHGFSGVDAPAAAPWLAGGASWEAGRWRLLLRRPLSPDGEGLTLPIGEPLPIAFYAWDGSSGETLTRGSLSGWYYLVLEAPRPAWVYAVPPAVALLTLGALLGAAAAARRALRAGSEHDPGAVGAPARP